MVWCITTEASINLRRLVRHSTATITRSLVIDIIVSTLSTYTHAAQTLGLGLPHHTARDFSDCAGRRLSENYYHRLGFLIPAVLATWLLIHKWWPATQSEGGSNS